MILNSLFPDTCYANESGGDPEDIPSLSYEQFLEFPRTYYHPSNSYIYLYGDMDMAEKLIWLDENYLSHFEELEINSEIKLQKPFKQMLDISKKYSIASNESEKENTYLSYNKVIGTSLDEKLYLAFEILDYALLSAPGAPLKKALIDAGIGKDVMGSYDNGIRSADLLCDCQKCGCVPEGRICTGYRKYIERDCEKRNRSESSGSRNQL